MTTATASFSRSRGGKALVVGRIAGQRRFGLPLGAGRARERAEAAPAAPFTTMSPAPRRSRATSARRVTADSSVRRKRMSSARNGKVLVRRLLHRGHELVLVPRTARHMRALHEPRLDGGGSGPGGAFGRRRPHEQVSGGPSESVLGAQSAAPRCRMLGVGPGQMCGESSDRRPDGRSAVGHGRFRRASRCSGWGRCGRRSGR